VELLVLILKGEASCSLVWEEMRERREDDVFLYFSDPILDHTSAGIDAKEAARSRLVVPLFLQIEP
jgi:hypothetical protein